MGCPDGYLQIEELTRPLNFGYWCGTSWGHNQYYSETSAVTIMLRVFNVSFSASDNPADARMGPMNRPGSNPGAFMPQDPMMLKLQYRFLKKEKSVLRYGVPYSPSFRGTGIPNTFCDKYFENCDKKNCKIQSPNFPGLYPRNLTCRYHIKQTAIPDGKVALVQVSQPNPHLFYIKDRNAPHVSRDQKLQVGSACHVLRDYLVVFDGNTTQSNVLATLCKGGTSVSSITASGPDLLLLFHTSAFDFPFQDSPRRKVFGFELDVKVEFVDKESTAYVRPGTECEFSISSKGQRSGYIQAPAHSLLPNTTCNWKLIAISPSEVVWLYFLHYRHIFHEDMPSPAQCSNTLFIYDGEITQVENSRNNSAVRLGQFCRKDKLPKVCSGVHAPGPNAVPCSPSDSYVSKSQILTLALRYAAGTAPAHVEFLARYEFVDQRQWGEPTPEGGPCDRTFTMMPRRLFASPRDVFLFGRGGRKRLKCTYTFKAEEHQRIELRIIRSKMGDDCHTVFQQTSRRYECSNNGDEGKSSIWISEEPWEGVSLTRACLCDTNDSNPFNLVSYSSSLQISFTVTNMNAASDYDDFFFEGEYNIVHAASALKEECNSTSRQLEGRHGNFTMGHGRGNPCHSQPRLVKAPDGAFIFLKLHGYGASATNCGVASRINIYAVGGVAPIASVCPERRDTFTHVFSSGWEEASQHKPTWRDRYNIADHEDYLDNVDDFNTTVMINFDNDHINHQKYLNPDDYDDLDMDEDEDKESDNQRKKGDKKSKKKNKKNKQKGERRRQKKLKKENEDKKINEDRRRQQEEQYIQQHQNLYIQQQQQQEQQNIPQALPRDPYNTNEENLYNQMDKDFLAQGKDPYHQYLDNLQKTK
ncbi:unnamed protein product [Meganyctiphanes norvegica]|uniref:CUB domain-containing protein n=1 Tax=Meganyctiphanes norvegica TaxID=48144 RepID=A0AAV2QWL5_MEGNR